MPIGANIIPSAVAVAVEEMAVAVAVVAETIYIIRLRARKVLMQGSNDNQAVCPHLNRSTDDGHHLLRIVNFEVGDQNR